MVSSTMSAVLLRLGTCGESETGGWMVALADRNTAVLDVGADISFAVWDRWLREQMSPVVPVSQEAYNFCVLFKVSPALA